MRPEIVHELIARFADLCEETGATMPEAYVAADSIRSASGDTLARRLAALGKRLEDGEEAGLRVVDGGKADGIQAPK
jgi:hypothetical protein